MQLSRIILVISGLLYDFFDDILLYVVFKCKEMFHNLQKYILIYNAQIYFKGITPLRHCAFTPLRLSALTPFCPCAFLPLRLYAFTPLRPCAFMPLRPYALTPLRPYALTPLCPYALTPLRLYALFNNNFPHIPLHSRLYLNKI
jgi:hypothetical protein